jgi:hypothetical protein
MDTLPWPWPPEGQYIWRVFVGVVSFNEFYVYRFFAQKNKLLLFYTSYSSHKELKMQNNKKKNK